MNTIIIYSHIVERKLQQTIVFLVVLNLIRPIKSTSNESSGESIAFEAYWNIFPKISRVVRHQRNEFLEDTIFLFFRHPSWSFSYLRSGIVSFLYELECGCLFISVILFEKEYFRGTFLNSAQTILER